jgi:hypothetical protein
MSTFSQFHVWATGETITAALLNGEIASIVTAGNNIDNNNIGTLGIYASQIKPTSGAQATFGGTNTYTFIAGEVVSSNNDASVPLAINGNSATQSAALLTVNQNAGGTLEFQIAGNGTGTINAPLILLNSANLNVAASAAIQANGAGDSIFLNVPTTSALGLQYRVNNVLFGGFNTTGVLSAGPLINALNTPGPVSPTYTAAGAAVAGTQHAVQGSVTATTTGSWLNGTLAAWSGGSNIATFTNNAVFASASSYSVVWTLVTALNIIVFAGGNVSGTQTGLFAYNASGGTIPTGTNITATYYAVGT